MGLTYKKTTQTVLKVGGYLDIDTMTIDVDGKPKSLKVLLKEYNGAPVEFSIKYKTEEVLDEPKEDADDFDQDDVYGYTD